MDKISKLITKFETETRESGEGDDEAAKKLFAQALPHFCLLMLSSAHKCRAVMKPPI